MEFDEMPPDGSTKSVVGYILLLIVLVILNAFFAMSELAIVSLNDNKVRRMAKDGDKKAVRLLRLIENPTNFLSTIQIGVTLSGFLASAVAADTFAGMIVSALSNTPIPSTLVHGISLFAITLILSFVTLVFGELVPKRIAMQNYEKISFTIVGALSALTFILTPMVWVVSNATNAVLRLIRIDPNQRPEEVTEEEIRMMLDVGNENGHIEESEKDMIYNIFEFDDRTVEDIMAHRTEIVAVEYNTPLKDIIEIALETGYSRIPVYKEDLDNVVGILYVKDLLKFLSTNPPAFHINEFMRTPVYVLESTIRRNLLAQFQETKIQIAIVVDEYGGTAGLVSMEDLLESIVGNIQDEYDDEEEDIITISDTEYIIDGLAPFETILRFFDLNVLESEEDSFDTIGGYVMAQIGQIPADGEFPTVIAGDIKFKVKEMNERRIAKLTATRLLPSQSDTSEDEDSEKEKEASASKE